jgi:hypothetical protein
LGAGAAAKAGELTIASNDKTHVNLFSTSKTSRFSPALREGEAESMAPLRRG